MHIIGITQARVGSSRLPGKILKSIGTKTLLEYHLESLVRSSLVDKWIVATTLEEGSEEIVAIAASLQINSYRGSIDDVLDRYYQTARVENPYYVVRVTSDCPLIDPVLIDLTIGFALKYKLAYCMTSAQYPDGVDVEVFEFKELEEAWQMTSLASDREHVTPYIRRKAKEKQHFWEFPCEADYSGIRITVDEPLDFAAVSVLLQEVGEKKSWKTYADFVLMHPVIFNNQNIVRNSGYIKSLKNDATQEDF